MTTLSELRESRSEMSLSVPPEFERAIRERVESGRYPSVEEVFRAALASLGEAEATDDEVRQAIDEGILSAETEPLIPGEDVVELMRAVARGERP